MSEEYKNQLFRLAATLYADNNYEVSTKTIHRKMIESVFLECQKKELTIHSLIDYISDNYKITFDEKTIKDIVKDKRDERFLLNYRKDELYIALSEKRKQSLLSKINKKTIDHFIDVFQVEFDFKEAKPLIHRFLYEVFSTNTNSFQKLLNNKKDISNLFNVDSSSYTDNDKEIINSFLHWDNNEKNKAIFDISSYALEYCMLTNKNGVTSIHLENLKNKSFYLDTNIIYRALGINGEDRQKRSTTFLKKFNDAGEKLIISRTTEVEFKEGLKGHIDKIRKFNNPRIGPGLYGEVNVQKDIYDFYHKWRIGKINDNLEKFQAEIFSSYENFKNDFKITTDYSIPFNPEQKDVEEKLKDYTSSISLFKQSEGHDINGSAYVDAENIYWLEQKRKVNTQSIFDTKFFLISTDQGLRRWDYHRKAQTPIVLLPSQWMSVLLRYINKTDDDFKSFVSFLNLKNNEILISNERLHIVLSGISEMTADISHQKFLIKTLVENHFDGVIEKGISNDQVYKNAKEFAESELEKRIKDLQEENKEIIQKQADTDSEFQEHRESLASELEKIKSEKDNFGDKLSKTEKENRKLKKKIFYIEVENDIKKWQRPAKYFWIPISFLLTLILLLSFVYQEKDWNFMVSLIENIDKEQSITKQWVYRIVLNIFVTVGIIGSINTSIKRLSKQNIDDQRDKIIKRKKDNNEE